MERKLISPVVVIDCRRNCIRIHRNALHLLGDPDYIILLVNPGNLTFAIIPSAKLQIAQAVHWEKIRNRRCFELYSKSLIRQLCKICPNWKDSEKFRMTGKYIRDENAIRFYLKGDVERMCD